MEQSLWQWGPAVVGAAGAAFGIALWRVGRGRDAALVGGCAALVVVSAVAALCPDSALGMVLPSAAAVLWVLYAALQLARGPLRDAAAACALWAPAFAVASALGFVRYPKVSGAELPFAVGALAVAACVPVRALVGIFRFALAEKVSAAVSGVVLLALAIPLSTEAVSVREPGICVLAGAVTALALYLVSASLSANEARWWTEVGTLVGVMVAVLGLAMAFRWHMGYGASLWTATVAVLAVLAVGAPMRGAEMWMAGVAGVLAGILRLMRETIGEGAGFTDPYGFVGLAVGVGIGVMAGFGCSGARALAWAVIFAAVSAAVAVFWGVDGLQGLCVGAAASVLAGYAVSRLFESGGERNGSDFDFPMPLGLGIASYVVGIPVMRAAAELTRAQKVLGAEVLAGAVAVVLFIVWAVRVRVSRPR
jgi:hypothetical protein